MKKGLFFLFTFLFIYQFSFSQSITGEFKKWHRVTLTFDGPNVAENDATNPFRDYRLNVTFTGPSNQTYIVPGFFAADGDAANTSANSGNKWRVHFSPDEIGQWSYTTSFRTGTDISISTITTDGNATSFDGSSGTIDIIASDKTGIDNRAKGRLNYVNERYLKFAETNTYFLKAGSDSPENLLAYQDFDDTANKTWSSHIQDWQTGDPVWQSNKGKGLIGAINYLASKGMNAFSFLPMNVNGDGNDVWPWTSQNERFRFDVSKLAQWEILFDHADKKGMFLHFKTQETENDQLLNNGDLGLERKLYYRELIARFSHHLALNWNLGEENTQTTQQRKDMAQYFNDTDPYRHLIVIHTYPGQQDQVYNPLLGNASELTGASIQIGINNVHDEVKDWVESSEASGKPWVVANDEIGPANVGVAADSDYTGNTGSQPDNRDAVRENVLWGTLMAGGAGVEYYFGYGTGETDLTCQDFRSRAHKWEDAKIALDFFNTYIPFWEMESTDSITTDNDAYCFSKTDDYYVIYIPGNDTTDINLGNTGNQFSIQWFDPRNGGALQNGSVTTISATGTVGIGNPPSDADKDWVVLLTNNNILSTDDFAINTIKLFPNPTKNIFYINGLRNGKYAVEIINSLGQKVSKLEVSNSEDSISTETLQKGLYFVIISSEGNSITKKLIIN